MIKTLVCLLLMGANAFAEPAASRVFVARVDGVINSGTEQYLTRAIYTAQMSLGKMLVIYLNTPGGTLAATRKIVEAISASKMPVTVYVAPSGAAATSAGTIITMAAHYAAMAPGTNIGAAHPVGGQGEDIKGAMSEKVVNDTVAFIRAQAQLRKRNADWAEQAIRKSVSVTADEALALKVVDYVEPDLNSLLTKLSSYVMVSQLPIAEIRMTPGERFMSFIGDPNVSYMLMALGGLGIYVEITTPGVILPGVLGAISLILSFIAFSTLSVNYGGVALMVLGMALFIAEAFVTSYGALTIGGVASLMMGSLLLLDPSTGDLRLSLSVILPTVLGIATVTGVIGYFAFKSRRTLLYGGVTRFEGYFGTVQRVDEDGRVGKCLIRGEVWDFEIDSAIADGPKTVHVGDRLAVTDVRQLKLIVRSV